MISPLGANGSGGPTEMMATPREPQEKKNTPASARVKPISCLAFSPDGHYLAAGEVSTSLLSKKENVYVVCCCCLCFSIVIDGAPTKDSYLECQGACTATSMPRSQIWDSLGGLLPKHAIPCLCWFPGLYRATH